MGGRPFTSETGKQARALQVRGRVFDRRAWGRNWMRRERECRRLMRLCLMCGQYPVARFKNCQRCRLRAAAAALRRWRAKQATA